MKVTMKQPRWLKIILICLTVLEILSVVYYVLKIFDVFDKPFQVMPDVSNMVLCVVSIFITISLLTISYHITDNQLKLKIAFFDLLAGKVTIASIVNMVYKVNEEKLYISYMCEQLDPVIVLINIPKDKIESFADYLKAQNSKIIYIKEE